MGRNGGLARYEAESERSVPKALQPIDGFGVNENGLLDVAGNAWQWTSTCFRRSLGPGAEMLTVRTENCGVRVVEGRHRIYVTDFIRDARAGGCAVETPPANLGFRLVRTVGQRVGCGFDKLGSPRWQLQYTLLNDVVQVRPEPHECPQKGCRSAAVFQSDARPPTLLGSESRRSDAS
jgi:Sulfatase-modifying factor enzyme 1